MAQVLNYHDAVVYDTDVELFGDGGWLNDNCINWFFRVLEHEVFPGRPELLFMDPAVVSCMMNQCDDPDEFVDLGKGLELDKRSVVFVPVNNASGRLSRGSHWSLLVFEREGKDVAATCSSSSTTTTTTTDSNSVMRFRHYDSSEGSNRQPAERTAENFLRMFDGSLVEPNVAARVEHVRDAPQQSNAFDCGMYTVLLAERLASKAMAAGAAPSTTAAVVEQPATTAALPVVAPEEVAVGATPAVEPRGTKISRQESDTVISRRDSEVARDAANGDVGGGRGIGGFGGGPENVAVTRGDVSAGAETISPDFVSSARALAREKLSRCIRSQGWC